MDQEKAKSIEKHNLRHALKSAVMKGNTQHIRNAAQAVFEAGYELEDLDFTPAFFDMIASAIIVSGWVPKVKHNHHEG